MNGLNRHDVEVLRRGGIDAAYVIREAAALLRECRSGMSWADSAQPEFTSGGWPVPDSLERMFEPQPDRLARLDEPTCRRFTTAEGKLYRRLARAFNARRFMAETRCAGYRGGHSHWAYGPVFVSATSARRHERAAGPLTCGCRGANS